MTKRRGSGVGGLAALAFLSAADPGGPSGAQAQEPPTEPFKLVGEVRDYATERPIKGAVVQIAELGRSAVTDRNGYFEFADLFPGRHTFVTSGFGYRTNREDSEVPPNAVLVVRLRAMAIELPGLEVTVERLLHRIEARRVASSAGEVAVFTRGQLTRSRAPGLEKFVGERTAGFELGPNRSDHLCVSVRGKSPQLVQVFLDEAAVPNLMLQTLKPDEVELVEVYRNLAMVRVYTKQFLEDAAYSGFAPRPVSRLAGRPCPRTAGDPALPAPGS